MTRIVYLSTDVEADGPIPAEYSMLSFGTVAFSESGKVVGRFYRKLKRLPGAKRHPAHMRWWKSYPAAWKEVNTGQEDPKRVMNDYYRWMVALRKKTGAELVFVSWPLAGDYMWVTWYLVRFVDRFRRVSLQDVPYMYHGIDIDSFAMAHSGKPYGEVWHGYVPDRLYRGRGDLTHKSVEDAMEQGRLFIGLLKESRAARRKARR